MGPVVKKHYEKFQGFVHRQKKYTVGFKKPVVKKANFDRKAKKVNSFLAAKSLSDIVVERAISSQNRLHSLLVKYKNLITKINIEMTVNNIVHKEDITEFISILEEINKFLE